MSKFYEVKKRDGAARIGKLTLRREENATKEVHTPLLLKVESLSSNFFSKEKTLAKRDKDNEGVVIFHPEDADFKNLCLEGAWNVPRGTLLFPSVHPFSKKVNKAITLFFDFFILSFASDMLNSPKDFVRRITATRNSIPSDVALYLPSIATPENASLLIYTGVDVIDNTNAVIKGYQGIYQMEESEKRISNLEELPCNCTVCTSLGIEELREKVCKEHFSLIAKHNTLLLEKELKKVRECIRSSNLREYVEMRVKASTFLTAVLRVLDTEEEYFEKRVPIARRSYMKINTMESLRRTEVKRFAKRIQERYTPLEKKILLILPCSARKPYSISLSHVKFIEAIKDFRGYIHELILTSPLGVVPRELEAIYPAAFYDIPVTGYWDGEEREWVRFCLKEYLQRNYNNYEAIVAHVNGAYKEICSMVAGELGIEIIHSCGEDEKTTSKEALQHLQTCISELCEEKDKLPEFKRKTNMIKAMANYQFGIDAGNKLLGGEGGVEKIKIVGKYPSYEVFSNKQKLARTMSQYGLLALTVKGAHKIEELESYKVRIGDFIPKDSILAPGVVNADSQIRVNDEVIFSGEEAFGVGRARMSGEEMVESRRGVAVAVREVE